MSLAIQLPYFLGFLVTLCFAEPGPGAQGPARKLAEEFRAMPPDQAFYLAGQLAGLAALDKEIEKAKQIWHVYAGEFRQQRYAAPAGVQAALLARFGAGGTEESDRIFRLVTRTSGQEPLEKSCREIARRWLARTQLAKLHQALKQYYWRKVEYPDRLEKLAAEGLATAEDLTSPWPSPFTYRLTESDLFPGVPGQAYDLSARELGKADRSTQEILQEWVAMLPRYVLWGVAKSADGRPAALIGLLEKGSEAGNKKSVVIGEEIEGKKLIEADNVGAILAADDYLLVLPQRVFHRPGQ
jgi:hypothetical protein